MRQASRVPRRDAIASMALLLNMEWRDDGAGVDWQGTWFVPSPFLGLVDYVTTLVVAQVDARASHADVASTSHHALVAVAAQFPSNVLLTPPSLTHCTPHTTTITSHACHWCSVLFYLRC